MGPIVMEGGEPFLLGGGETGCLLVHGFTGTPREMRRLGAALAAQGHTLHAPRLFAHATRQVDMERARWRDWIASVEDGLALLDGICERVVLVGLSMGGALSLLCASHPSVRGVVVMATPYDFPDSRVPKVRAVLPAVSRVVRSVPKEAAHWDDPSAAQGHLEYPGFPMRAVAELHDLLARMREELPAVRVPVQLIYSKADRSVVAAHGETMRAALAHTEVALEWLETSGHNLPNDSGREVVADVVARFVAERGAPPR